MGEIVGPQPEPPTKATRKPKPITAIALGIGFVMAIVAILALSRWKLGDESGSLAFVTIDATLALALAAVLTLQQNVALVAAALDEAKASADQARASNETVQEMQRQRELAYRPWLVYTGMQVDPNIRGPQLFPMQRFGFKNIGTGPAVNVCLSATRAGADETRFFQSHSIRGIAAGDEWSPLSSYTANTDPGTPRPDRYRCVTDDLAINEAAEVVAVRYEDWFGNHYRSPGSSTDPNPILWIGDRSLARAPDWLRCN